jgi:hypothetical protein
VEIYVNWLPVASLWFAVALMLVKIILCCLAIDFWFGVNGGSDILFEKIVPWQQNVRSLGMIGYLGSSL